ncbi:Aminoalkylphosphonate N-acetyltransferase (KAT) (Peptidyl-lysine N-acetyltransferase) [Durusdinium trenchii]|uniref:Aminoalkylphosphonate N-acetyltransferase (KAT) (Peptidyl-lysine N-acetyltransferase) n=1 Tax=Durusdinium trenchii TaxID=1381693 RepID=A0ABP0RA26_9DINO
MSAVGAPLEAPKQQILDTTSDIQIQCLQRDSSPELVRQVASLHYDGFGSKRCCLCFGDTNSELVSNLSSAVARVPDSKLEAYAVAVLDGDAVGFAQLGFHDTPGDIMMPYAFQTKPSAGTCHLERIVVSSKVRGKGLGTKLLAWVDSKARERECKTVKLEVVSNNPAKKLYERQGYVSHTSTAAKVCMCPCVFCLLGHLYFDAMYKTL